MVSFKKTISIRWSDMDPNFHLRHSVYYDFGAQQRFEILEQCGLTMQEMKRQGIGPVVFREECVFKKEILFSDIITISAKLSKMKPDGSRFTIQHEFLNNENQLCALLSLDCAWIDTKARKLANPVPQIVGEILQQFPRSGEFILL